MQSTPRMQPDAQTSSAELTDYLRPLWRRKWLILFIAAAATTGAYLYYDAKPREYVAASQVLVSVSLLEQALYNQATPANNERLVVNQARLLRSRPVASEVAKSIGYTGDLGELLAAVIATPVEGSDFVEVTARGGSGMEAARLSDAFAEAFVKLREDSVRRKVRNALVAARREIAAVGSARADAPERGALRAQLTRLRAIQSLPAGNAEIVERAQPPEFPIAPRPKRSAAFALVLSLLLGTVLAVGLDRIDRRVRRLDDMEAAYDPLPVLTVVPQERRVARFIEGEVTLPDGLREGMRNLRANLKLAGLDRPIRTILVTSAIPSEGKSTVVRNLAVACYEAGDRVAILECDLRRPSMAQLMGVSPRPGLTDVLLGNASLDAAVQHVTVHVQGLKEFAEALGEPHLNETISRDGVQAAEDAYLNVVTAGLRPPDPSTVIGSAALWQLVEDAKEHHDMVILDTPPLLPVSDTIPLLTEVDAVVIVGRVGLTTRDAARRVLQLWERTGAPVIGVVANATSEEEFRGGYRYYEYAEVAKPRAGARM